jgi:hypothetical protein
VLVGSLFHIPFYGSNSFVEQSLNLSDDVDLVLDLRNSRGVSSVKFFASLDLVIEGLDSSVKLSLSIGLACSSGLNVECQFLEIGLLSFGLISEIFNFFFHVSDEISEIGSSINIVVN